MIRILLADDFTIIRKGVRQMIISDLPRPDRGGYNALQRIREDFPELPVLILSLYTKKYHAFRALQAGASGYLGKDAAPDDLLWAVRQILAGKKYIAIPRDN